MQSCYECRLSEKSNVEMKKEKISFGPDPDPVLHLEARVALDLDPYSTKDVLNLEHFEVKGDSKHCSQSRAKKVWILVARFLIPIISVADPDPVGSVYYWLSWIRIQ